MKALASIPVRIDRYDAAVGLVAERRHLHGAQMRDALGKYRIMVKQVPVSLELADRVMGRPADYRGQYFPPVRERPVRAVSGGIANKMRIAG